MSTSGLYSSLKRSLAVVFVSTLVVMFLYEYVKQALNPSISIWESHAITIVFTSIIAVIIVWFPLRSELREREKARASETALAESGEKFRGVAERSSDLIILTDLAGKAVYVSPSVRGILGYDPGEILGKSSSDFIHPDNMGDVSEGVRKNIAGVSTEHIEVRIRKNDGSYAVLDVAGSPVTKEGKAVGLQVVGRDITEQTRAEAEQEQIRSWQAGVNKILESILKPAPLDEKLKIITDGVVEHFGADFCRIWLIDRGDRCSTGCMHAGVTEGPHVCRFHDKCLHLRSSSGRYTHLDGKAHRRVPFGAYKIGRIASGEETRFLTNDVTRDPRVHDHAWAESLGLVSFAGYRLKPPDGDVLGVFALFAQFPVSPAMDAIFEGLSRAISLVIQQDITGRALQESENLLGEVGRMAHVGGWETDVATEAVRWTDETYRIHDIPAGTPIDLTRALLFFDMPERTALEAAIVRCRETGEPYDLELPFTSATGRHLWTRAIGRAVREDGRVVKLTGTFQDITERKIAEDRIGELLRVQKEQLRIINTSPAVAFLWRATENWPVETVSENISQFGYTQEDFISGRIRYSAIIHPGDLERVGAEVEHNSAHGIDDYTQEYRIFGKGGDVFWVADYTHIRRDTAGKITHYEGIVLDITDRKQMEEAIRESEQKFREIFDNANDGIEIVGLDNNGFPGRFIDANAVACRMLHYTREELLKMGPLDINTENFSRPFDQIMAELHRIGHATFETEHRTKEGLVFPVEVNTHLVSILRKRVIISVVRDITDRKQAEDALRASERRSATLLEAIPDMMFIISREGVYRDFRVPDPSVLAIPAEKIIGTNVRDSGFPEESTRSILRHIAVALETKEHQLFDYEITFPQGMRQYEARLVALNEDEVLGIVRDISERKAAEAEIRRSRQLFSDIISFLPDPTLVIDRDGVVLAWNRAMEQLSAVPAREIIGRGDHEYSLWLYGKRRPILIDLVLHPDQDAARMDYVNIRSEGSTLMAETQAVLSTGKEVALSLVSSPLVDENGSVTGAIESMRDITSIRETEAELARLNAHLEQIVKERTRALEEEVVQRMQAEKDVQAALDYTRSVIEANPDLMVVLDETGVILDVNAAGELLTGIPKEQLIGTPYFGYLVEDGTVQSAFAGLLQEGTIENFVRIRRTDGHVTPLSVHATVVRGWKGGNDRIIVSAHDITRQKQDEEAIRSSRQMLTNIVENFPGVVFWKDKNSVYLGCNKNFSDGAGLEDPAEIAGKTDFDLPWAKTEAESYRSYDREVMGEGKPRLNIIETQLQRDGSVVWFNTNKVPLFGPDGTVIGILGSSHDITRQKQDEEAIRASLEEKVILLREVHHRVKNNLQIIISLVNLQMRKLEDPQLKQVMAETQNRVRAMSLVHEKLYQSESLSRIDFADYTRFLATQLFSYYGVDTRKVRLDFAMGKIMVDINTAVPLGLLMNELISNALKHAFPDGREGRISIGGSEEDNLITLVVRDNGIGMPADLDWKSTTTLGMRLITSLIDQIDGTIELASGEGTTFTIKIRKTSGGKTG